MTVPFGTNDAPENKAPTIKDQNQHKSFSNWWHFSTLLVFYSYTFSSSLHVGHTKDSNYSSFDLSQKSDSESDEF
jgi:hypothetical protein